MSRNMGRQLENLTEEEVDRHPQRCASRGLGIGSGTYKKIQAPREMKAEVVGTDKSGPRG